MRLIDQSIKAEDATKHGSLLTSDIQTVPPPDFALTVQHHKAPLVRHPDWVQHHPFLRHAEASYVFFCQHRRLVVQHHGWRLCCMLYLSLVGMNQIGPGINMTSYWIQITESFCLFVSVSLSLTVPELQGDGAFDVVEMDGVSVSVLHHLLQSAVWSTTREEMKVKAGRVCTNQLRCCCWLSDSLNLALNLQTRTESSVFPVKPLRICAGYK